jgi:hypothetical protein
VSGHPTIEPTGEPVGIRDAARLSVRIHHLMIGSTDERLRRVVARRFRRLFDHPVIGDYRLGLDESMESVARAIRVDNRLWTTGKRP